MNAFCTVNFAIIAYLSVYTYEMLWSGEALDSGPQLGCVNPLGLNASWLSPQNRSKEMLFCEYA